jgi:hypothetical protein
VSRSADLSQAHAVGRIDRLHVQDAFLEQRTYFDSSAIWGRPSPARLGRHLGAVSEVSSVLGQITELT